MELRDYQQNLITNTATKLAEGKRIIIVQLATGGGKTISFASIAERYNNKSGKSVLILVHRKELLQQTRRTLHNHFNIDCQVIVAGMKSVPTAKVYVGMVESVKRRIKLIKDIGMVIIDECHIDTFNKLHEHYPNEYIIGFSATPLSANKKNPLKNYYEDIVCGIDIPELIAQGSLCQNITYSPKDVVQRSSLTIKNGEYDTGLMSLAFSAPKYINNTVDQYEKKIIGQKTIIFNVNIEHSISVHNAFIEAGYNSRHLDSTMSARERTDTLKWFAETHDAILNNVGILTAGFDEPTIEAVIFNKATTSLTLWLQCTGRGSRPTDAKSLFTIIDMGGNAVTHGDWCDPVDWENLFWNPPKGGKGDGVAPIKECENCDAIIGLRVMECPHCGHKVEKSQEEIFEEEMSDFVVATKGINVKELIELHKNRKLYFSYFNIAKQLANSAKQTMPKMTMESAEYILYNSYYPKAKEWCHANNKMFNDWHKDLAKETLFNELKEKFRNWKI